MDILFVHHNIPSQYHNIISTLSKKPGIRIRCLGHGRSNHHLPEAAIHEKYGLTRKNTVGIESLAIEFESKLIRGRACAERAHQLKLSGYTPDIICAHPGWGEVLFLKDIWPATPLLSYQEFSYKGINSDLDFDLEFEQTINWEILARCRTKQANVLLNLEASDWCVSPTYFQKSTFPATYQPRISVVHDGINCQIAMPATGHQAVMLPNGIVLDSNEHVVTYVSRSLEPYRGIHSFLRAVPEIHRREPRAKVVVVGKEEGVSYGSQCPFAATWKDYLLREIEGQYDPGRIFFLGHISHSLFIRLMQVSSAHVYLTYPFVLSWSMLEAMACGCAVVGSATAPVEEVIQDGHNGLLVDFFSPSAIAAAVLDLLENPNHAEAMRHQARQTVLEHYSLNRCLPQQLALIELVRNGTLRASA